MHQYKRGICSHTTARAAVIKHERPSDQSESSTLQHRGIMAFKGTVTLKACRKNAIRAAIENEFTQNYILPSSSSLYSWTFLCSPVPGGAPSHPACNSSSLVWFPSIGFSSYSITPLGAAQMFMHELISQNTGTFSINQPWL